MKRFLLVVTIIFWAASAYAANWYVDCAVSSSGNGQSWATAWKNLNNITGPSAGDTVYISGSSSCSAYSLSQWIPVNGTASNPITYSIGQDAGHTSPITITLSGSPGMWGAGSGGAFTGIYLNGNYEGTQSITLIGGIGAAGSNAFNGVRFSYLIFIGNINMNSMNGFQLDNCIAYTPNNSDHFFTNSGWLCSGADPKCTYTLNNIFNNLIYICNVAGSGLGDDGFQWIENTTFYNNSIIGIPVSTNGTVINGNTMCVGTYTSGQHQDGIQTNRSYLNIYDNYYENLNDSAFYGDVLGGTQSYVNIYNNVMYNVPPQNITIGCDGTACTMTNFLIANNTIVDGGSGGCISMNNGTAGTVTSSYVVNNICYNTTGGIYLTPGSGGSITSSNNYGSVGNTAGVSFVNVASYPEGNFNLLSTATSAIGQGIDPAPSYLTSVFTTDKAGNTRVNPWDLGAYMYVGLVPSPPSDLLVQ